MYPLLWAALCSALPAWSLSSDLNGCLVQESVLQHESALMKSLHCNNDYESWVHCRWRKHGQTDLQLWFKTEEKDELCEPYEAEEPDVSEHRTVHCRYKNKVLSFGVTHTVFFLEEKAVCSSVPQQLVDLSQLLRARPPGDLSTRDAGDGGRHITWSSPYPSPSSSSSLNATFQLGYRTDAQDGWTTLGVSNTSVRLQKHQLTRGLRYKARVRARTDTAQWSVWSPVATWTTEHDAGRSPSMHCILEGENDVMCSWELSRQEAHVASYQLACRRNRTAASERCCVNQTVTSDPSGTLLKYSCRLSITGSEHLLLELQQTRNAKMFEAYKHIRPKPPRQLQVREKGSNWRVEWTDPIMSFILSLKYEVCYHTVEEEGCSVPNSVAAGSTFWPILQTSLLPSQRYRVRVRSLVNYEPDSEYEAIPSKWTDPVEWTSHEASWSPDTLIYCSIALLVIVVFVTLYCTVPACQRRVVLWVDSVPSPGKSKILSEVKSATSWSLMQSEHTSFCKVQHSDSLSTCSSITSLWPTKDPEGRSLEEDEGCWSNDNLPVSAEKVKDASSLSFSGPYIFCESLEPNKTPEDLKREEEERGTPSGDSAPLSQGSFTQWGGDYVRLPGRVVSSQDLLSPSDTSSYDSAEQDQQSPGTPPWLDRTDVQTTPAYTAVTFTSWPQEGAVQASGYCHLPTAHISAAE